MSHDEPSPDQHSALDDLAEELDQIERRSPLARTLITVLITVVVAAVLIGLVLAVSLMMRETRTATSQVDASDVPQVAVRATNADVRVVEGSGDDIRIRAEVTSGLLSTDYELRRRGTEIEVVSGCLRWVNPGCGVQVVVEVPAALPVEITTVRGDIGVDGLVDRVLTVSSATGNITARGLDVDELDATTGSGSVTAVFEGQPFAVKATTRSGDVSLTLPDGDLGYQVQAVSDDGEVTQDLAADDEGEGFVRVRSESGDLVLTGG